MLKLIIHRGARMIGGTCIELKTANHRILLDLGMPLMGNDGAELETMDKQDTRRLLPPIPGLDGVSKPRIDAVIVSHAHPDHYGLLKHLPRSIPVWMSEETKALIGVGNIFYPETHAQPRLEDYRTFKHGTPFEIGDFRISPHLIDHSAFGASSLLIEACGRRILYTGDLRAHGRKGKLFRALPSKVGHVDCMLMEGTTLGGRHHAGFDSEQEVEAALVEAINGRHPTFVQASGSNVDFLVSLYRACKQKKKTMVIDLYQYFLLTKLKGFSRGLPPHQGDHLRVFFENRQKQRLVDHGEQAFLQAANARTITPTEMIKRANSLVLRLSWHFMDKIARRLSGKPAPVFIYSMWKGYLERNPDMAAFPSKHGGEWNIIHTSGHAWLEDLQWLVAKINPDRLVPIHTLQSDDFAKYFKNVVSIEDGVAWYYE